MEKLKIMKKRRQQELFFLPSRFAFFSFPSALLHGSKLDDERVTFFVTTLSMDPLGGFA